LHFQIVFHHLIPKSTSLRDIHNAMQILSLNLEVYERLKNEVEDSLQPLVQSIRTSTCESHDASKEVDARAFLKTLHHYGKRVHEILSFTEDCIISGSFAVALYSLLYDGTMLFHPDDIDIYLPWSNLNHKKSHGFFQDLKRKYESEYESLIPEENLLQKLRRDFPHVNWCAFDTRFTRLHKTKPNIKLVYKNWEVDVIMTYRSYTTCLEDYAMFVMNNFDMYQCCCSILEIDGTFYPHMYKLQPFDECMKEKKIVLNRSCAFRCNYHKQVQRIRKYETRGFCLI
jgi:hypothetical protein